MLALCSSSGYSQGWRWLAPWGSFGGCTYWPAAGFSSEPRAGVDALKSSPARKWRAMGRIEQTLLDGDVAPTDLRPSLANRTITPSPLNVVNVHRSVFKAQERGYRLSAHRRHGTASKTSTSSPVPGSSTRCPT